MKYDQLVHKILEIINFQEDKQDFINKLNQMALNFTTIALFETLDKSKREAAIKELSSINDTANLKLELLHKYFSDEQITKLMDIEYGTLIESFIKKVYPNTNEDQRKMILELLN